MHDDLSNGTGKVHSLGMTGAAPRVVAPDAMTADTLNTGIKAALVSGNVGGYLSALERCGTMGVGDVLTPAIAYAEGGYPIDESLAAVIQRSKKLRFTSALGGMQGILVDPATGAMGAGADPRRTGDAIGY